MTLILVVLLTVLSVAPAPVFGKLVGYGIWPYEPVCAMACLRSLESYMLSCTDDSAPETNMDDGSSTTPACYASSTPWLTTIAWCLHTYCAGGDSASVTGDVGHAVRNSTLERWWEDMVTGAVDVAPMWGYLEALATVTEAPTSEAGTATMDMAGMAMPVLNETMSLPYATWLAQRNTLWSVQRENVVESGFGIALLVAGFATPIGLAALAHVPGMARVVARAKPYLVYPSLIGTYQVRPLPWLLGNAPTVGQALWIAAFVILNVLLSAVNYKTLLPQAWYANMWQEVVAFVFYRTGVLGFVMLPLLLLFSSRNNVLLWLTDWSHATYLMLHRWVARLFVLYAVLHSILAVLLWKAYGSFSTMSQTTMWQWGIVATIFAVTLGVASGLYVRRFAYEAFLLSHIAMTVLVLVGCWYHILTWEGVSLTWGYETWLYAAFAIWGFDRLARVVRLLQNGVLRATVTDLGGGYVRVDVPGVRWGTEPGKHAYACFPGLQAKTWTPWEHHPFSIVPTALLASAAVGATTATTYNPPSIDKKDHEPVSIRHSDVNADMEQQQQQQEQQLTDPKVPDVHVGNTNRPAATNGVTLFIKKDRGATRLLEPQSHVLTLLEGPYGNARLAQRILHCDRVLLIGGGIGITSLLAWVSAHRNVRLCWSVKQAAQRLVEQVTGVLERYLPDPENRDVVVGGRLNAREIVAEEARAGWGTVGVVVCGPGGLCDDVRAVVAAAGRKGRTVFEIDVDAYSW